MHNCIPSPVPDSMAVTKAKAYADANLLSKGWSTAVAMFLIAISIAAGLLVAQGLALAVAWLGGWCSQRGHEPRQRRRGTIQGGIDSVYF